MRALVYLPYLRHMSNFDPIGSAVAADILGTDRRTVLRLAERGDLPGSKVGDGKTSSYVFDRSEVEQLAAERAR